MRFFYKIFGMIAGGMLAIPAQAQQTAPTPMLPPPALGEPAAQLIDAAIKNGQLSATQKSAVEKANAWFNATLVLSAQFLQTAPDGSQSQGQVFMAKPGRVRFQYAKPSPLEIIADGTSVAVRDRSLNTQDIYPLSQTPLRFLLQPNLDLARDSNLVAASENQGLVTIVVEDSNTVTGTSRLSILMADEPLALKQWTITDSQGLNTTVTLSNMDTTTKPANNLFRIDYTRDVAGESNR